LVVPLKLNDFLPPTVTWVGVVLVPAIWFLAMIALVSPVRTIRHLWINTACSLMCLVVGAGAVYWQGWV